MLVLFLRAIMLYIIVFIVMRLMGKRQVSDLQPFDLVVTLLIAELAGDPISDTSIPMLYGVLPILALFLLQQLMAWLSLKNERIRGMFSGKPLIVIAKGVVQEDVMRSAHYTLNDLLEQLRAKDVFELSEVEYAIIETDGSLSVLKKGAKQQPLMEDLKLKPHADALVHLLVLDGRIHQRALEQCGHSQDWLLRQLNALGFQDAKEVFFASFNAMTGELLAQRRQGKISTGVPKQYTLKLKGK